MTKQFNYPVIEINCETGEETIREATEAELELAFKNVKEEAKLQAEAEAKAAQRQALLDKLGITAEEAQLLLGGN